MKRFNESMKTSRAGMPLASEEISVSDSELLGGYRSGVTRIGAGAVAGRIVLLWYGKGGAHPNCSLGTVVIATTTATPVTVDDLYRDRSAALDRLRSLLPELDPTKRVDTVMGTHFADAWLPTSAGLEVYVPIAHIAGDYAPIVVPWATSPTNSDQEYWNNYAPTDRPQGITNYRGRGLT